jgi:hypothetical protein
MRGPAIFDPFIASFLLLCLLFVQLGNEWSVAAWLPLFVIHRLGVGSGNGRLFLELLLLALLLVRAVANRLAAKVGGRALARTGTALALAGCLILSLSTSVVGSGWLCPHLQLDLRRPTPS